MELTTTTPRIYVACLASYNAGILHGAWIDCDSVDQMQKEISKILKSSTEPYAEEYAIHDYEGFEGYRVSEYESLETLAELSLAIEEHGAVIPAIMDHGLCDNVEDAIQYHEDNYCGEFDDWKDYAYDCVDNGLYGDIPEAIANYIDYDSIAYELEIDLTGLEIDGSLHIYNNR